MAHDAHFSRPAGQGNSGLSFRKRERVLVKCHMSLANPHFERRIVSERRGKEHKPFSSRWSLAAYEK